MNPYGFSLWCELRMYVATLFLDAMIKAMPEPERSRLVAYLLPYLYEVCNHR